MQAHQNHRLDPLLSTEEARLTLRVSRSKFDALVHSGALPVVWIGARRRVRSSDLTSYVDNLQANRENGGRR